MHQSIISGKQPPIEQTYWVQVIHGEGWYGNILNNLNSPIHVMLPKNSSSSNEEWASTHYITFKQESMTIKEMIWEHIQTQRLELAQDLIKEVAAIQYLKKRVDNNEEEDHADIMRVLCK